ncbi:MAG: exodeoxyribonuclease III [Candidatus Paceibacterota bacterium]
MKIISWNTNGLRATIKQGNFDPLFNKYKPDIVCLQETKAEKEQLPNEVQNYFGYNSYFSHSKTRKGYSGVAIYTKVLPDKVEEGMGVPELDQEGRLLVLYFEKGFTGLKNKVILINGYYPNGGSGPDRLEFKLKFYDAFLKFINKKRKLGYEIVFTGDVNTAHTAIDLARPKANEENTGFLPIERAWIDRVIKDDYIDTFRHLHPQTLDMYTYWDQKTGARARNVGWRIDYFFVSSPLIKKVKDSYMLTDYMGSDHCPLVLELK